ncbi:MAG: amidophosphoribosyltransferase [Atopobiaceae bacterium]|nr:amidophosphoribosyltransferase [Atopobiaceae bacterium]MCH4181106.1 amidophosphoribosyltransferase [Atopobiaceae bacterium]MCH4214095.1 amidophosphoribosyltransferase [Atopobiaceae bacterium]MCH4230362.1 amidophosphoribosyltransferase [Atopobiaceae bacterium]MCH4276447.1 amidophosphoribosyltransferase [Atopobiaceae bacterium]
MTPTSRPASTGAYDDERDQLHEECGVFGIWAPGHDVARMTYFALRALQHRGQESAGIAVGDGHTVLVRKDLGLVSQVFTDSDLAAMPGHVAVGHVRYGTSGAKSWEAAQPHLSAINDVIIALAHNGTLVNSDELRRELVNLGIPFRSNTDSEVAAKLVGYFTEQTHHITQGIARMMSMVEGGYAMALVREDALYAFRDPHGIRPLVLGRLAADAGWVVASETCALDILGAEYVRDVVPGEIIRISGDGLSSLQGVSREIPANCIFEDVYFSRPDSIAGGRSIYSMRYAMGAELARESPADADLVIGVPDSGLPPAEGFAHELGLPFGEGLIKNRYVARTFIQPTQELRELGVRLKLNALRDNVAGKRLVMIDDSIVRGTTSKQIVRMLKDAGALEVHVRINSPEVIWPCFYGIDTDTQDQLISANKSVDEICDYIGADSLAFLSVPGLLKSVPMSGYCQACFTGEYPVEIPESFSAGKFLEGYEPNNLSHASRTSQMRIEDLVPDGPGDSTTEKGSTR